MAIHNTAETQMQGGFVKEIEASAMHMALDVLQKFQYQYPIKSTIRELVSNAVDSTRERQIAIEILTGAADELDYYIRRDDEMYKDSNFDPNYYDMAHLGTATKVQVIYEEGVGLAKDKVRIIDEGVGLGGKRMEGYFKLNWSSKRNNKAALGKWGLGAKAALSTGVDFYTVINRYNGMEFTFNVYSHKVDSIVPPFYFDANGQKQFNGRVVMYQGTPNEYNAYWVPTTKPNGVEVIIETKKHRKQEYLEAVKSQLMYFDNVELMVKNEYGTVQIPTKANVLYEDDYLIVSDNNQYSKPHLVINKVNYGFVDFQELELEQKFGPVGIKVAAEEVEVSPSRESVIWSDTTKATVVKRFQQAAGAATKLVQERLKETDFVGWLKAWASIKNSYNRHNSNDALTKLSGIIDMSQIEPLFQPDPTLKAGAMPLLFPGMLVQKITRINNYKGGKSVQKLDRQEVQWVNDLGSGSPIFITNAKPSVKTLRYLATNYSYGFYLIRYPENLEVEGAADAEETEDWIKAFSLYPAFDVAVKGTGDPEIRGQNKAVASALQILKERRKRVVRLLTASVHTQQLSSVVVPDTFSWLDEEDETTSDVAVNAESVVPITAEERRKLEERVVAFTPRGFEALPNKWGAKDGEQRLFEWQKVEPKLAKVKSLQGEDIYYGTTKDEVAMHLMAAITQPKLADNFYGVPLYEWEEFRHGSPFREEWGMHNTYTHNRYISHWGPKAKCTIIKVAQDQVKHYKSYKTVSEFFLQIDNDTITMAKALIKWHTARLIVKELGKLKFFQNFGSINPDLANKYQKLKAYVTDNYVDVDRVSKGKYWGLTSDVYNEMIDHHDKVAQLQLFIRKNPDDKEAIAEMSKSLFDEEFTGASGLDLEVYDMLQELLEYSEPIRTLLNTIPAFIEYDKTVSSDLEQEVRFYLNAKGVDA